MDDVHLLTARHFRYELRATSYELRAAEKFSAVNLERARCASRHKGRALWTQLLAKEKFSSYPHILLQVGIYARALLQTHIKGQEKK